MLMPALSQNVTLESGAFTMLTLPWNTTGFAKGNYTIKATAEKVPDETKSYYGFRVCACACIMCLLLRSILLG